MMFTYDMGALWIDHEHATASFPMRIAHYFDDSHHLNVVAYAIDDADMESPRGMPWGDIVNQRHALIITLFDYEAAMAYQFTGTLEGWGQIAGNPRVTLRFAVVGPPHATTSTVDAVTLA